MESGFDTDAYFRRIGYAGSSEPTLDTLCALVAAHNRAIPFENLDPLLGTPVYDLSPTALSDKLVRRRRGGYCFEQNGLMRYALTELGFGVDALAGRVVWMRPDGLAGPPAAQTHNVLSVSVGGVDGRFLVDVGFGGQTLSSPIPLQANVVAQTRHEPYRISEHGDRLVLEACVRDTWQPLYVFSRQPQPLIDLQVASWYVSTFPESHFVTSLMVALVTDDARWNLSGRNLAIHRADTTERIRFETAAQVADALTKRFGIDLSGLGDVEARVNEVLDA
ncbi:MAG TPA: arylamine N-acetyltransferase [Mycobacterium sp.]